jgi:hypothetical protein
MSSRRLLLLIERLPEDGAFKTAWRDGNWTLDRIIAKETLNDLRAFRADIRAMIAQERMPFEPILSPAEEVEGEEGRQLSRDLHDGIMAQLRGETRD